MSFSGLIKFLSLWALSSLVFANEVFPPLKLGVPGQKKGDIIAPVIDEQIAAWCDFTKQIVVTKKNVLCAYVGGKSMPAPQKPEPVVSSAKKKGPADIKDLNPTLYEMSEYGGAET